MSVNVCPVLLLTFERAKKGEGLTFVMAITLNHILYQPKGSEAAFMLIIKLRNDLSERT